MHTVAAMNIVSDFPSEMTSEQVEQCIDQINRAPQRMRDILEAKIREKDTESLIQSIKRRLSYFPSVDSELNWMVLAFPLVAGVGLLISGIADAPHLAADYFVE